MIVSVTGEITPERLGYCHCHEHLFIANGTCAGEGGSLLLDSYDNARDELLLYKAAGGRSIVDAQPVGCGRMAELQYKASCETGVNVIASTGFHKLIFYPENHWLRTLDADALAGIFVRELTAGMYIHCDDAVPYEQTPYRAGLIKTATDAQGIVGEYTKLFAAAARACLETGTPVMSHTELGSHALEQVAFYTEKGIPAHALIICHTDRVVTDFADQLALAKTGVYVELDTIGRLKYHSDELEAQLIIKLVEEGFADQILLGLDVTRGRMKSYGATIGLDYIATVFIPLLRQFGISEQLIHQFLVENPAKALRNYR